MIRLPCHRSVGALGFVLSLGFVCLPGAFPLSAAEAPEAGAAKPEVTHRKDPSGHWAFKPPVRPALPKVSSPAWARGEIDRFILATLDREGLKPSPEADRPTLLRRASLDLIGLPPTPEEVDAFLADRSRDAYEKQVDRLLASPHFGERWGRLWLDAARYADSDGFEKDKLSTKGEFRK